MDEQLIRIKIFAYIRSHTLTDGASYFVVSEEAYYNLAVQGGPAFIVLRSTAAAPHPVIKLSLVGRGH